VRKQEEAYREVAAHDAQVRNSISPATYYNSIETLEEYRGLVSSDVDNPATGTCVCVQCVVKNPADRAKWKDWNWGAGALVWSNVSAHQRKAHGKPVTTLTSNQKQTLQKQAKKIMGMMSKQSTKLSRSFARVSGETVKKKDLAVMAMLDGVLDKSKVCSSRVAAAAAVENSDENEFVFSSEGQLTPHLVADTCEGELSRMEGGEDEVVKRLELSPVKDKPNEYSFSHGFSDKVAKVVLGKLGRMQSFNGIAADSKDLARYHALYEHNHVNRETVSRFCAVLAAEGHRLLVEILEECDHFALSFDACRHMHVDHNDIRVRVAVDCEIYDLHAAQFPLWESHTGEYMYEQLAEFLDITDAGWADKLVGSTTDAASNNMGKTNGANTRLAKECAKVDGTPFCIHHCIPHKYSLLIRDALKGLGIVVEVITLVGRLRRYKRRSVCVCACVCVEVCVRVWRCVCGGVCACVEVCVCVWRWRCVCGVQLCVCAIIYIHTHTAHSQAPGCSCQSRNLCRPIYLQDALCIHFCVCGVAR
jgi:hypothetical protein